MTTKRSSEGGISLDGIEGRPASEVTFRVASIANGSLITGIGPSVIWMVINGVRHAYYAWEQFTRVHPANARTYPHPEVDTLPEGTPFDDNVSLISYTNGPLYLLNYGRKRAMSAAVRDAYQYTATVKFASQEIIAAIPEDPPLE